MNHKMYPPEEEQFPNPEQYGGGTLHINSPFISDSSGDQFAEDASYSTIGSNNKYDELSYAPTEDFQSCASGSGIYSLKSRAYRRTFLHDINASILKSIGGNDGFDSGYNNFSEKTSVIALSGLAFLAYLLLGTLAFSFYYEHWSPIDAMYFTVVTFTTAGYGDLVPVGDNERLFTLIFIIIGISVLGGICLTVIFDNVFGAYEDMIGRAKQKSAAKFMKDSMDKVEKRDKNLYFQQSTPSTKSISSENSPSYLNEIKSLWPFLLLISLGAAYIGYANQWSVITTLYFFVVTATSVGYGDVAPESQPSRLFAVIFIPFSVVVVAELFGRLIGVYLERKTHEAEDEFLSRRMTLEDFNRMDTDQDGSVTYDEFIKFFLVQMGKVEEQEMDRLKQLYDKFDVNNDGSIQLDDLILMAKKGSSGFAT